MIIYSVQSDNYDDKSKITIIPIFIVLNSVFLTF